MAEEREAVKKAAEESDVEGHALKKRDDAPTVEREAAPIARDDDDGPDVEAHALRKN
jgi:hypothetical protein